MRVDDNDVEKREIDKIGGYGRLQTIALRTSTFIVCWREEYSSKNENRAFTPSCCPIKKHRQRLGNNPTAKGRTKTSEPKPYTVPTTPRANRAL